MSAVSAVSGSGRMAARLDRLPVTWAQWRLALITQVFWGISIAADGIPAKLYPYIWGPHHDFGVGAFSVLLAFQFGVGILLGEYVISFIADRMGRRAALLISALVEGLVLWPTALTHNFAALMVLFTISSMGMGGVLSTNVAYMAEIVPPNNRSRVLQTTQILAIVIFGLLGNLPALLWVPSHYHLFIYLFSVCCIVVLVPLGLWLPESPRWLEAHGRHQQAEEVVERLENECRRRSGKELPEPEYERYEVPITKRVPVLDIFKGEYASRTVILLICWVCGYGGLVYGFAGYEPTLLAARGLTSGQVFLDIMLSSVGGGGLGLLITALLGERVERKTVVLGAAIVNAAGLWALFLVHTVWMAFVGVFFGWGAESVFLFNLYNYTANAFPTRVRSVGTGWTDGIGHIGAIFGSIFAGVVFAATAHAGYIGWFAFITIPGALLPGVLLFVAGIKQRRTVLEEVAK